MTAAAVLELILISAKGLAEMSNIYAKAVAERRDLTPEEVDVVRSKARASIDKLKA